MVHCEDIGRKKPGTRPGELNREVSRLGDVGYRVPWRCLSSVGKVYNPIRGVVSMYNKQDQV